MQLLFIASFLLSAVAAHRGDDKQMVTHAPEDVSEGSGGDSGHPVWPHQMPTWLPSRPSRGPGNGNPQGPKTGIVGNDRQPGRPSQVPVRGKRQAPGFMTDEPGVPHPGPGRQFGKHKGHPRDKFPNRKNPGAMVFSPIVVVDNVTFQNVTDVTLKEGENIFLMPKHGGRGPHHHKGGRHGRHGTGQYVKLIYNTTEPNKVSIEYGLLKPMNLGKLVGESDNLEEDY